MWDKTKGYCYYCGDHLNPWVNFAVDHIQPVSRGGANDISNLAPVCRLCNSRKGKWHMEHLRKILAREQAGELHRDNRVRLLRAVGFTDFEPGPLYRFKFYFEIAGVYEV